MGYQPKIIRGKVKGTGYPIDGRELLFSLWDYDNYESYHLSGWHNDDDEAVMLTIHQSEEEAGLCVYDTLGDFASAWEEGEYEAEGAFCLDPNNVDVLEVIQEEKRSSGEGAKIDGKIKSENWILTAEHLPPENQVVDTKIDDEKGVRNETQLIFCNNLWWLPDKSMYVYYTPTHWRYRMPLCGKDGTSQ